MRFRDRVEGPSGVYRYLELSDLAMILNCNWVKREPSRQRLPVLSNVTVEQTTSEVY